MGGSARELVKSDCDSPQQQVFSFPYCHFSAYYQVYYCCFDKRGAFKQEKTTAASSASAPMIVLLEAALSRCLVAWILGPPS